MGRQMMAYRAVPAQGHLAGTAPSDHITVNLWVPKTRITWADALRSAVPGPVPDEPVPDPPGVR